MPNSENNAFSFKLLDTVSVIVQIGGKEYPMKVNAADEQKVRKAATLLNEQLIKYKSNFSIVEKQDLLAIVAFDAVFERLSMEEQRMGMLQGIASEIDALTHQLSE